MRYHADMRRAIRTLLSCFLMLAIPLQGIAAASMLACGPHHAALAQRADAARHDHAAGHAQHQHDAMPAAGVDDDGPGGSFELFNFKCSACAACCTVSAMPAAPMPALAFVPSIGVAIPFFGSSFAGIVPDGLERPPSQHLA